MATNRNDDMDRNRNTPQGSATQTSGSEIGRDMNRDRQEQGRTTGSEQGRTGSESMGNTSQDNMGQTGRDPVNRDREMNRDTEVGQRGSGSGQSGRDTFGSDRGTTDTSRNTGRGGSDIEE